MNMQVLALGGIVSIIFLGSAVETQAVGPDLNSRLLSIRERLEERTGKLEERLQEAQQRVESSRQRLCDQLSEFEHINLPPFCNDDEPEPEPEAPILDFDASQDEIEEGATSTLSWDSENADACEASDGWSGNRAVAGSEIVSPATTTTYTLTCTGEGGTTTESVTVTVTEEEPEPEPEAPILDFEANPESVAIGATSTLSWNSENTDTCEAGDGWTGTKTVDGSEMVTVNATTTYTLTCVGEGGTTTESVTVNAVDEPESPALDHLVISEVFYDVDAEHGVEGDNEWVEIHNPTNSTVDLMGWVIGNSSTTGEVISTSTLELDPGEYLIITNSTTTDDFWDFSNAAEVVFLGTNINGGFANTGDYVGLFDNENGFIIDDVSYGSNTDAFDPSVPGVPEGSSIARVLAVVDTNTAADWEEADPPTPGE